MSKEINTNPQEHSSSARMLDKIIYLTLPQKYPLYRQYWSLIRGLDNIVDEGSSYTTADNFLKEQLLLSNSKSGSPKSHYGETLLSVISQIPYQLEERFISHHLSLIDYFNLDLNHRLNLTPYQKEEMDRHINGGFPEVFANLKIILYQKDLSPEDSFFKLAKTHGHIEPLYDLEEDLERGLILHSREDALWVNKLREGYPIPDQDIDNYVLSRRKDLAKKLRLESPSAIKGFGGHIGGLITLDYLKRSLISLPRLRFQPKSPVIFAKQRLYQ